MLKKLRVRFVCITMVIVLVMLGIIFGTVLHFTGENLARESLSMMQSVAADPLRLNWPGESASRLPYFTVRFTPFNEVRVSGTSVYDLTDSETLGNIVSGALNSGEDTGFLAQYNLRYLRTVKHGEEYIIFADVSSEKTTMSNLVKLCAVIGVASLGVFLLISIVLARWAVKPVDKAWAQQRQFVSDASHELKTPLTVILTNAELLQDDTYDESSRKQFSDNILTMAHQMRGLVEGLLDLARADNKAMQSTFESLDLSALAEDAVLPFEPVFFEKGLTLKTEIDSGIRCRGSRQYLRQVMEILLDNAQKYSSPGTVSLKLEKQGHSHCLLTVTSPGTPLSSEECKNIFKRFYRADKARGADGSYGLGLSIAESVVADHGGKIWCEGGDGKNTFFVSLPRET
jgi:signal transduction histidine kinase